jgi:Undecaprenyl-phosphate glucose phosphotransferase
LTLRQQSGIKAGRIIADLVAVNLAWIAAYYIRFFTFLETPLGVPAQHLYFKLLPFIAIIWALVFFVLGFYRRSGRHRSAFVEGLDIIYCSVFAILALIAFSYFYEEYRYSRISLFVFAVIQPVFVIISRSLIRKLMRRRRDRSGPKKCLIIASQEYIDDAFEFVNREPFSRKEIVSWFCFQENLSHKMLKSSHMPGLDQWDEFLISNQIEQAMVALNDKEMTDFLPYLNAIGQQVPQFDVLPDFKKFRGFTPIVSETSGTIHLQFRASPLDGEGLLIKRVWDILLSFVGLILLMPLLIVVGVVIKVTSAGPVLYRQKRMGLDGRTFEILKFRSMPIDAENKTGAIWAKAGDNRATKFGAFIRKTSIDELPQIMNILRGEMSVVGPRPERPVFVDDFRRQIPEYMLRHKVKAGLTGWAQVNGWRGNTSLEKRIECDLFYIQNWSIWLDIKIIMMTLIKVFYDRNAY